jgi:hypothetical protein
MSLRAGTGKSGSQSIDQNVLLVRHFFSGAVLSVNKKSSDQYPLFQVNRSQILDRSTPSLAEAQRFM